MQTKTTPTAVATFSFISRMKCPFYWMLKDAYFFFTILIFSTISIILYFTMFLPRVADVCFETVNKHYNHNLTLLLQQATSILQPHLQSTDKKENLSCMCIKELNCGAADNYFTECHFSWSSAISSFPTFLRYHRKRFWKQLNEV